MALKKSTIIAYYVRYGMKGLIHKVLERRKMSKVYYAYRNNEDSFFGTERHLKGGAESGLKSKGPKISILMPVFDPNEEAFTDALMSVKKQTYRNYELCISDGGNARFKHCVDAIFGDDKRVKYSASDKPLGISDNSNAARNLATGEYIALFDHDDILESNALMEMAAKAINDNYDMIYSDEDKVNSKLTRYYKPYYKPDFNLPLLLSNNYICHFTMIKSRLFDMVGGFRSEYDGAQDYDLFLRVAGATNRIGHIPLILYHWRDSEASTSANPFNKEYAYKRGLLALKDYFKSKKVKALVTELDDPGYYHARYQGKVSNAYMEYSFIPSVNMTGDEKVALLQDAVMYGADVVIPRLVRKGKYAYNGVASSGDVKTLSIAGKPAYLRGPFNMAISSLRVCEAPDDYVLVKNSKIKNFTEGKRSNLKMYYDGQITLDISKISK